MLQWDGHYSQMQAKAAEQARLFASASVGGQSFLLWAVCGAGKTELLFPAVAERLSRGERVLIATPRKDVVLELVPRLKKVFPAVTVIAVHGSSGEKWEDAQLVIATT
ncbi:DEAD/DEAH box helicase family protein, partial [Frankia sp. Cpl3]|nr:DEAD/DEAH box helicase family protein [Frankia sp. Cpl3]